MGAQHTLNLFCPVPSLHSVPDVQHSLAEAPVWHMAAQHQAMEVLR